jgi:PAS domain S-box-containing protein
MTDDAKRSSTPPPEVHADEVLILVERLADELNYYKTLFDQLPIGIYRTSKDGVILKANATLAEILGYTVDELKFIPASKLFADPADREDQLVRWKKATGVVSDVLRMVTEDGREIRVRDTGRAILDDNGEIAYFDGVIEPLDRD